MIDAHAGWVWDSSGITTSRRLESMKILKSNTGLPCVVFLMSTVEVFRWLPKASPVMRAMHVVARLWYVGKS
jgi:hypothetical protein